MAIKIIKQQIDKFLNNKTPEVMAIKGSWGVGKTYTWNKYLEEAKIENRISLDRYAYVSLFGINSLDSFKYSIFENIIDTKLIGTEANIDTFKENTANLIASLGRKSLVFFKGSPLLKNFTPAIESLSFLHLSKTLICIDDLERKGNSLSIKDTLGLISLLKEQKHCKIILLLNDREEGLEEYQKYREKVIDIELQFSPTAEECTAIAYEKKGIFEFDELTKLTQKLGIRNIRVLKKIERLVELAFPLILKYEEEVKTQIVRSLTLFSWCFYCYKDGAPTLDFVNNRHHRPNPFLVIREEDKEDKEENEEEKKWDAILSEHGGYSFPDDLDFVLEEAVKFGYFDEEKLRTVASKKNLQVIASKLKGSFSFAWSLYHYSFNDNQDEVIESLYRCFKKNSKYITPEELNSTVILFKEFEENKKALEIINIYIEERKEEIELFNMKEARYYFEGGVDKDITKRFNETYEENAKIKTASEVLALISTGNGWNPEDEVILAKTTVEEYYNLFKTESGPFLPSYIKKCLTFGSYSNSSEQNKQITQRATEALKRIASESEINKHRVKRFGIEV